MDVTAVGAALAPCPAFIGTPLQGSPPAPTPPVVHRMYPGGTGTRSTGATLVTWSPGHLVTWRRCRWRRPRIRVRGRTAARRSRAPQGRSRPRRRRWRRREPRSRSGPTGSGADASRPSTVRRAMQLSSRIGRPPRRQGGRCTGRRSRPRTAHPLPGMRRHPGRPSVRPTLRQSPAIPAGRATRSPVGTSRDVPCGNGLSAFPSCFLPPRGTDRPSRRGMPLAVDGTGSVRFRRLRDSATSGFAQGYTSLAERLEEVGQLIKKSLEGPDCDGQEAENSQDPDDGGVHRFDFPSLTEGGRTESVRGRPQLDHHAMRAVVS